MATNLVKAVRYHVKNESIAVNAPGYSLIQPYFDQYLKRRHFYNEYGKKQLFDTLIELPILSQDNDPSNMEIRNAKYIEGGNKLKIKYWDTSNGGGGWLYVAKFDLVDKYALEGNSLNSDNIHIHKVLDNNVPKSPEWTFDGSEYDSNEWTFVESKLQSWDASWIHLNEYIDGQGDTVNVYYYERDGVFENSDNGNIDQFGLDFGLAFGNGGSIYDWIIYWFEGVGEQEGVSDFGTKNITDFVWKNDGSKYYLVGSGSDPTEIAQYDVFDDYVYKKKENNGSVISDDISTNFGKFLEFSSDGKKFWSNGNEYTLGKKWDITTINNEASNTDISGKNISWKKN